MESFVIENTEAEAKHAIALNLMYIVEGLLLMSEDTPLEDDVRYIQALENLQEIAYELRNLTAS